MIRMARKVLLLLTALLIPGSAQADESSNKKKVASGKARIQEAAESKADKQAKKKKVAKKAEPPAPAPTLDNVSYGPHPKQVLTFWKAETEQPAPLLFFIHGGGGRPAIA